MNRTKNKYSHFVSKYRKKSGYSEIWELAIRIIDNELGFQA